MSQTEGLMRVAERIYQANGVTTEIVRPVDFEVAAGLFMDLASTPGWDRHDWPQIQAKVDAVDILIIGPLRHVSQGRRCGCHGA